MTIELPTAITRRDDGIVIDWGRERGPVWLAARDLRLACPCAMCIEEMTGRSLLDPMTVPLDVRPLRLSLVGGYGLRIEWSDGHSTGIYPFAWLRTRPGAPPPTP